MSYKHIIILFIGIWICNDVNAQYNAKGYQIATNNQYYDLPITAEVNPDGNIKTVQTRLLFAQKDIHKPIAVFQEAGVSGIFLIVREVYAEPVYVKGKISGESLILLCNPAGKVEEEWMIIFGFRDTIKDSKYPMVVKIENEAGYYMSIFSQDNEVCPVNKFNRSEHTMNQLKDFYRGCYEVEF